MAKIIAVMNEKGGVGKSATATTLAYLLTKRGKRTALIDFDGQGHSSIIYGVKNINKLETTINTLLRKVMEDEPLGNLHKPFDALRFPSCDILLIHPGMLPII